LSEMLESYDARGSLSGFSFGSIRVKAGPSRLPVDPASVRVVGGSSGELRFKYATDHSFSASLRDPFPVLREVSGRFDGKNIDVSVQGVRFRPRPALAGDALRSHKNNFGQSAGGFRAIGLANDPEITGEIDLDGASFKILGCSQRTWALECGDRREGEECIGYGPFGESGQGDGRIELPGDVRSLDAFRAHRFGEDSQQIAPELGSWSSRASTPKATLPAT